MPKIVDKKFSNNLKKYRVARGFSQQRLAELVGMSRSYISETELGTQRLTLKAATRIAPFLTVSPQELLGMDAIKYVGTFKETCKHLVDANFDAMVEGRSNGTVSDEEFDIYMICFNVLNGKMTESDLKVVRAVVDNIYLRNTGDNK